MGMGNRRDKCEPEPRALTPPARIKPHEAAEHAATIGDGNAGAVVGDDKLGTIRACPRGERDDAARGGVAQGIVDEI